MVESGEEEEEEELSDEEIERRRQMLREKVLNRREEEQVVVLDKEKEGRKATHSRRVHPSRQNTRSTATLKRRQAHV
jgi:hypothetical protein